MLRVLSTVRHLKPSQLFYLIKFRLRSIEKLESTIYSGTLNRKLNFICLDPERSIITNNQNLLRVNILNRVKYFNDKIIWSDDEFGRLWNYNLQYADFLKQDNLSTSLKEELIKDLYKYLIEGLLAPEPYPASQRLMNTIRFLNTNTQGIGDKRGLSNCIYSELHFLENNLEYHISGNHLLENGFALLMGGTFFQNRDWIITAKNLLREELENQILDDGAHYERSVMYHKLLLFRLLEASYYINSDDTFKNYLERVATKMFSWLSHMTFSNGEVAHFNDSTNGVALSNSSLIELAVISEVPTTLKLPPGESGFRKISTKTFELIADVCGIQPVHQPGHAHADSLSFILASKGTPFITDPSISTYDNMDDRQFEKSTAAHNTVTISNQNTADLWGSFRVGRRPNVKILQHSSNILSAELSFTFQNGQEFIHQRKWVTSKTNLKIQDSVKSNKAAVGKLHFAPGVQISKIDDTTVYLSNLVIIEFKDVLSLQKYEYPFCIEFNKRVQAEGIRYDFKKSCSFRVYLHDN